MYRGEKLVWRLVAIAVAVVLAISIIRLVLDGAAR